MPVMTKCLEARWATYFNSSQGREKTQEGHMTPASPSHIGLNSQATSGGKGRRWESLSRLRKPRIDNYRHQEE